MLVIITYKEMIVVRVGLEVGVEINTERKRRGGEGGEVEVKRRGGAGGKGAALVIFR